MESTDGQSKHLEHMTDRPDRAEMMNHPDNYSEEELSALLNDAETNEDFRNLLLARMANKRKRVGTPNVEQTWQTFKTRVTEEKPRKQRIVWRMWGATLAGAAAMLAGVLVYNYLTKSNDSADNDMVVAMLYDKTPQQITLQHDEALIDLSNNDSLSFKVSSPIVAAATSAAHAAAEEPKMQKLSTPRGMDFKVILPDGSEVWLNAESTIEFPSAFLEGERRVLLKGEAYFKVTENKNFPFVVVTDQMKVRVLGTEFNFRCYASASSHVSLIKGSVEVLRPDADQPDVTLAPGQDAWRDKDGVIKVQEVDTYAVTQWVNGFFYFDNLPLVEVLCELGRWYNLGVVFHNKTFMYNKMHFSASRNEEIGQAINNLNRLRKGRICIESTDIVVY